MTRSTRARRVLRTGLVAVAAAAIIGVGAACGGSDSDSESDATTEQTTTERTSTEAGTEVSQRGRELALLLPADDAIADLGAGSLTELGTAAELVDRLYSEGDPGRDAAVERFEAGGYDLGVLRDQVRFGPGEGPQLVRSYVVGFATPSAARTEVGESIAEVRRSSAVPSTDVAVPDIPGAAAIHLEVDSDEGPAADVLFVSFSAGRFLYGIQVFGEQGGAVDEGVILQAAEDAYERAPGS